MDTPGEITRLPFCPVPGARLLAVLMYAILAAAPCAVAQVTRDVPIDIRAGIIAGTIRLHSVPPLGDDSLKPFDGSLTTGATLRGSHTLTITLQSDSPMRLQRTCVCFAAAGIWRMAAAESPGDLESGSGSYSVLVPARACAPGKPDSAFFPARRARLVRLMFESDSSSSICEWRISRNVTFVGITVVPSQARVMPGTRLTLRPELLDRSARRFAYCLPGRLFWKVADPSIATVEDDGSVSGITPGATTLTVMTNPPVLRATIPVRVEKEFFGGTATPIHASVALILLDPKLPPSGERMHRRFRWRDPMALTEDIVRHFREASDGTMQFSIDTVIDADRFFTRYHGTLISVEHFAGLLSRKGWDSLRIAADSNQLWFDYRALVRAYHLDDLRNSGRIDEVWVYGAPYMGMYESQLMGPGAFWWNSPPLTDGTSLTRLLSVMGLNYERGVDLALHSFGHRFESAMTETYRRVLGREWNDTSALPTPWDLFTRINKDVAGGSHVGNIHFPPNGTHDYDYADTVHVRSYAGNWFRYPWLLDQTAMVNDSTWLYRGKDSLAESAAQLGYMRWWYDHIPRYAGATDGVSNNWWMYFAGDAGGRRPVGRTARVQGSG